MVSPQNHVNRLVNNVNQYRFARLENQANTNILYVIAELDPAGTCTLFKN